MSLIGTTLGRIRIVDSLGKGGMGEVYVGWDETLKRRVALKAIHGAQRFDAEAKARFLREARILSQLDHPGICRIYDFVEVEESDFLVLELIEGQSLRQALEDGLEDSYKLFIAEKVAEALAAAHAKGVAHRDLKPENVMLTDDGQVKVLDFGLARSIDSQLARASKEDRAAEAEISPERDPSRHTTLPGPRYESAPTAEVISETVAQVTAPGAAPPTSDSDLFETQAGTVMGTLAFMSPEQARGERATAAGDMYSLGLLIQTMFTGRTAYEPGLPLIQMLTQVAEGETLPVTGVDPNLAELVERLKSVSPEARPSAIETAERLWWLRGKRARLWRRLAIAAVVVAMISGGVKYTLDLRYERSAAEAARLQAEEAQRQAEEVSEYLIDVFAVSNPEATGGANVSARELLDAGAARISEELGEQPLTQARMMATIGRVYRQLGLYDRALTLLEGAWEIRQQNSGDPLGNVLYLDLLANLYHDVGRYGEAEPLFRRALEIREESLGEEHLHVAESLHNLGFFYLSSNQAELAEPLFLRALEIFRSNLGDEHPRVARTLTNLGNLYRAQGNHLLAENFLRRSIGLQEKLLGAEHPSLATGLNNLAIVYHEEGKADLAEPLYQRTLGIFERVYGPEHPDVATALDNLAELYRLTGRFEEAEPLFERALRIQEKALGPAHPRVADTLVQQADLYADRNEDERAEPLYRRALDIQERAWGGGHPVIAQTLADLAALHTRRGELTRAEECFDRSLAIGEAVFGREPENRRTRERLAAALIGAGKLYRAMGAEARATEAWERAALLMEPLTAGSGAIAYLHTHSRALLYLSRVEEARPMALKLLSNGWSQPDFLELCRQHGIALTGAA